ncbi:MAG: glycosyltransferase [Acidobacteria bacterium]|nr:glycosyltransferase [Acidobacteriota bacterium]
MAGPTVSFVIPVRNDATRLRRCLESIRADGTRVATEIIVADNGSSDDSAATARAFGASVLDLPDRPVSEVRNAAARTATGDLLAFVDADHTITNGWTDAAVALLADPATWAAGADYHAPADGTWVQRMYDNLRSRAPEPRTAEWLPSGNLVVRRTRFEHVGGFDTGLESCEDVDLSRKLREAGGRLVTSDALRTVHHGDPRSLRALFLAELWRGRDNLRVTLRDRLTPKAVLGLGLTLAQLLALVAVLGGVATLGIGGRRVAIAGAVTLSLLAIARMVRLLSRIPSERRRLQHVPQAILVASVYDSARALALFVRVGHDVRRKAGR